MKATRSWNFRFTALAATLAPAAIAAFASSACSSSSDDSAPADITSSDDAGSSVLTPTDDGGTEQDANAAEDASADASADADAAVPQRTCSDEGWCRTVVPDKQTLRDVWGDGNGTAWTVSEQGNILRYDGTTWVQSYAAGVPLYAIWGSSPTDLWAGGGVKTMYSQVLPGTLLHGTGTSPSNITWTVVSAPVTIRSIWGTSATDVWAAASVTHRVAAVDPAYVLHYSGPSGPTANADAGTGDGWAVDAVSTAIPTHFEKLWGTSADDIWVTGRIAVNSYTNVGQVVHRRPDGAGGFTWVKEQPTTTAAARTDTFGFSTSASTAFLVSFAADPSSKPYWHVGTRNNDATFTWAQHTVAETGFTDNALTLLWGTGTNDIWAAGQRGRIRHWDGTTWQVANVSVDPNMPMQNPVWATWGTQPNDLWVVGADVALHKIAPSKP